jgi:uncharacterized protein
MVEKIDKKSLLYFLGLTFGITLLAVVILWSLGITLVGNQAIIAQITIGALMFVPGICALLVRKFVTKEKLFSGIKFGKISDYWKIALLIPATFIVIYFITGLFYTSDFGLVSFSESYNIPIPPFPLLILLGIFAITVLISPIMNSILGFGEEYGWRGFLLEKLMPLGRKKALILSSIIWGLWHVPFILFLGFIYSSQTVLGSLIFVSLITLVGIIVGSYYLDSKSLIFVAFVHGVINAQSYGVWSIIFPKINPIIGGVNGIIGVLVLLPIAMWFLNKKKSR